MPMWPYGPGPWEGWGWMIGGWMTMIVFWGLIAAGIVVVVRALANRNVPGQARQDSAMEILRRRYAAGEIGKEQFEEMKRTLG